MRTSIYTILFVDLIKTKEPFRASVYKRTSNKRSFPWKAFNGLLTPKRPLKRVFLGDFFKGTSKILFSMEGL